MDRDEFRDEFSIYPDCGRDTAYRRHRAKGTVTCGPCRVATSAARTAHNLATGESATLRIEALVIQELLAIPGARAVLARVLHPRVRAAIANLESANA